jgi:hypothetical protein
MQGMGWVTGVTLMSLYVLYTSKATSVGEARSLGAAPLEPEARLRAV